VVNTGLSTARAVRRYKARHTPRARASTNMRRQKKTASDLSIETPLKPHHIQQM